MLVAIAWRAGTLSSLRGHLPWLLAFAWRRSRSVPMIAAGETHVASSTAAIVIATVPLIIALLSLRFEPSERVTGCASRASCRPRRVAFLVGVDVSGTPANSSAWGPS